jgi:hypothetical protein
MLVWKYLEGGCDGLFEGIFQIYFWRKIKAADGLLIVGCTLCHI